MPEPNKKEYFYSLTSLRGIAALWVSIGHISWTLPSAPLIAIFPMIRHGYLAVDFFFILSGFILAYSYNLHNIEAFPDYMRFCRARIARILPIHLFILIILGILYVIFLKSGITLPGIYNLKAFIAEFFLLHIVPFFDQKYFFAWNYPSWTLGLELWWFIIISGGIVIWNGLIKKYLPERLNILRRRNTFLIIAFGLLFILVGILMLGRSSSFIDNPHFYNSLVRSGLEFLAGLFLYKAFSIKQFNLTKYQLYLIYAFIVGGVCIWFFPIYSYIVVSYWLVLIPFIIIASLEGKSVLHKCLIHPALVHLGSISYSLYLIHGPIERIIAAIYPRLEYSKVNIIGIYALFIAGIIILSSLSYMYVEKPLIRYFKSKFY